MPTFGHMPLILAPDILHTDVSYMLAHFLRDTDSVCFPRLRVSPEDDSSQVPEQDRTKLSKRHGAVSVGEPEPKCPFL